MNTLIVDLFAGGGGVSEGIRLALGRDPDVAINHDPVAIAMHKANHPSTRHLIQDIWKVPPRWVTRRQPVGLLWASPDCRHFSKAKGAAPKRDHKIRSLAWVVEKWARDVFPNVIILENVEEFKEWGPLDRHGKVISSQAGATFRAFTRRLRRLGYRHEQRELRACDYGAPTIRKRLILIARRDDDPIVWPDPTHGPGLEPYNTAADIIDWSIPCPSIFERKRPLVENTMRRIAEGIRRYVIDAEEPFIVTCNHGGKSFRGQGLKEPFRTVTASRDAHGLVIPKIAPFCTSYYGPKPGEKFRGFGMKNAVPTQTTANRFGLVVPHIQHQFGNSVGAGVEKPIGTITAGGAGKTALVAAFIAKHFSGVVGAPVDTPLPTTTCRGTQNQLVTSHLLKLRGSCRDGQSVDRPMPPVTAGGNHIGEVRAFLMKYYSTGGQWQDMRDPVHTITAKDRLGLVTVNIHGEPYIITDIGMRMLSPRELFRAQGFMDSYIIDVAIKGRRITKTAQVRCCGNSVCPPLARALVAANASRLARLGVVERTAA